MVRKILLKAKHQIISLNL